MADLKLYHFVFKLFIAITNLTVLQIAIESNSLMLIHSCTCGICIYGLNLWYQVSSGATSPSNVPGQKTSSPSSDRPSDTSSAKSEYTPPQIHIRSNSSPSPAVLSSSNPTSNPLLDTIGALATTNVDSDDSDLDIVYQQLRYRGRHRRPEQVRIRTQRTTHRHQHQHVSSHCSLKV